MERMVKLGDKNGCLTIIENNLIINTNTAVKLRCDCGNIIIKRVARFKRDRCRYCSYDCKLRNIVRKEKYLVNVGEQYGNLVVIDNPIFKISGKKRNKRIQYVRCKCKCGNIKIIGCYPLKRGHTKSCNSCFKIDINGFKLCSKCWNKKSSDNFINNFNECKDCRKIYWFESKYDLSENEYKNLLMKQNNKCAICNQKSDLVVDHNHKSGEIRGLLCRLCNSGLGMFLDNIENLQKAIIYLNETNIIPR